MSQDLSKAFSGFLVQVEKKMLDEMKGPKKKVIVLSGPTGVGKTQFSIELAKQINCEIVSADSMQVYRELNIGTAKPTKEQQRQVPHHLIDIRNISDHFNVVDFCYEAHRCCEEILSREKIPLVVGGSGFYLHSFLYGPPSGPPPSPELRTSMEDEIEEKGIDFLFQRLKSLDPQYASTITNKDRQKIIRGLEIITLSGQKVSKISWKGKKIPQNFDFQCWFLHRPKDVLYPRIEKRCDAMIAEGILDETKKYKEEIEKNSSVAHAIGYLQALDYLKSAQTEEDYENFEMKFKQASRRYAKRQLTWFRKEPLFRWLDMEMHDPEIALDMVSRDSEGN
ncbi:MAG: tRNA (adenosine(37)-N6)-dimethylallyltransferase MiaA [Waddliaceae bacterium]